MSAIKNLTSASAQEVKTFVNSFDNVFFDIDGVLFLGGQPIPGADMCVQKLRNLNKKIVAVTNNTVYSLELIEKVLQPLNLTKEFIVNPHRSMIEYLKIINFKRGLVVIGSGATKAALADAGFKIVNFEPDKLDDSYGSVMDDIRSISNTKEDVGAIILDMDINFQLLQAQRAIVLLQTRDDVLLLSGMSDFEIPLSKNIKLLGPRFIQNAVETITQKQSVKFAKPSQKLQETLNADFGVTDPQKVLFVGDSITSDMSFASMCGYQKLLVLTGASKQQDLVNWVHPEEYKPRYYLNGLKDFYEVLEKMDN